MPKKTSLEIECPKCDGKGKIALPEKLRATLRTLTWMGSGHALDVIRRMPKERGRITVNAINNRLEDLLELGFVTFVKEGKFKVYSPIKP